MKKRSHDYILFDAALNLSPPKEGEGFNPRLSARIVEFIATLTRPLSPASFRANYRPKWTRFKYIYIHTHAHTHTHGLPGTVNPAWARMLCRALTRQIMDTCSFALCQPTISAEEEDGEKLDELL